jgi:hypothetical protein
VDELNKMDKDVYRILLTPISCEKKKIEQIEIKEEIIYTSQKYYSSVDEDMSDFSMGFYQIIYKDILKGKPLLYKDRLFDKQFAAGDTMNSYKTIEKKARNLVDITEDNSFLENYKKIYHCLANFWLVPIYIGRDSRWTPKELKNWTKTSRRSGEEPIEDYMDRFLNLYKENEVVFKSKYETYFSNFGDFKDFAKKHFLLGSNNLVNVDGKINNYSNLKPQEVVEKMESNIKERASCIAKSKYALDLRDYFKNNHLL